MALNNKKKKYKTIWEKDVKAKGHTPQKSEASTNIRDVGVYKYRLQYGVSKTYQDFRSEFKKAREGLYQAKRSGLFTESQFKEYKKKLQYERAKLFGQINPAKAQIKRFKNKKVLGTSLVTYNYMEGLNKVKSSKLSATRLGKYEMQRDLILKQLRQQATRFNKYEKSLNFNNLYIRYKGEKRTVASLIELQRATGTLTTQERYQLNKKLEQVVGKIKLIKPSKSTIGQFTLSGDLTKVRKPISWLNETIDDLDEKFDYADSITTQINGWVVKWKVTTSPPIKVLGALITKRGNGIFDVEAHVQDLQNQVTIDKSDSYFYKIINQLKQAGR